MQNLKLESKCNVKIIDWNIDGQCVLLYANGDVVARPSYKDAGNQRFIGNMLKNSIKSIWEEYPFKENHMEYYSEKH